MKLKNIPGPGTWAPGTMFTEQSAGIDVADKVGESEPWVLITSQPLDVERGAWLLARLTDPFFAPVFSAVFRADLRLLARNEPGYPLVLAKSALRDLGEHRLKDIPESTRLWQAGTGEFPPPRSLNLSRLPLPAA